MQPEDRLSNTELLASFTGKAAAHAILQKYDSLSALASASFDELLGVPGVGPSKAAAVRAAFHLAQRLSRESRAEAPTIDAPSTVADLLREEFRPLTVERMVVLLLNARRRLISTVPLSDGTLDSVLVHPREVFAPAVAKHAFAVVLAHNHPSGDPTPSAADIRVTMDLQNAGKIIRVQVLDHVIVGKRTLERPVDYVSLRELGLIRGEAEPGVGQIPPR